MATLTLDHHITRFRQRIRLLLAVRWAVLFALSGVIASLVTLLVLRIAGLPFSVEQDAAFLVGCLAVGALFGYLRRVTPLQAAVTTDARLGLRERLSSALALQRAPDPDGMIGALVVDATQHADQVDARQVYPLRLPRETRFLAGGLALLALAVFLPNLSIFQSPQKRAEREAMRISGDRIVRIAKEIRKNANGRNAELERRIAKNMEHLGKDMRAARIGKKQALVKLNKMSKQLADAQRKMAQGSAQKSLAQAGADLKKSAGEKAANAQMAKNAQRLQQMASALSKNDMESAAKLLEKMAAALAGGKMSAQQKEQMAKELEKMAKALSGTQLQEVAKQLQQAAKILQQGNIQMAIRQINKAGGG